MVFGLVLALGVSTVAFAAGPPSAGVDLPDNATVADLWQLDPSDGSWDPPTTAKAWNSAISANNPTTNGGTKVGGFCNKESWTFNFTNHASVAQWINWTISGNRKDWRILKPGTYASNCISFDVASNNDVLITFSGFGDLKYQADGGVNQYIKTEYGVWNEDMPFDPNNVYWISADALNNLKLRLMDSAALHNSRNFKLFSKITVENCNSSSEYENVGQVTLSVRNLKNWVDAESGGFKDIQTGKLDGGYWKGLESGETVVPETL